MSQPDPCPRCGAPLPSGGALRSLCPACLLAAGRGPGDSAVPGAPPLPDIEEIRARFREFEVLEPIGRGGMGVVYCARQPKLDRLVALKVLSTEAAADPAFAERFLREARALARLSHPNVVAVYDFGEVEGQYFLLMEYVDGVSLRERLTAGDLTAGDVLEIVPQICAGLQYAHEKGVVHRDIKPENILLDDRGGVKIADFGLAKIFRGDEPALTRGTQVMGTPHYMAPEQVNRPLEVDHRADIYSLGVVLYEMLTSELPVGRFAPPSERAAANARFDPVVLRALEREPKDRYQRADEVRSDVEGAGGEPAPASGAGPAARRSWTAAAPADAAAPDEEGVPVLWFEREAIPPWAIGVIALILSWILIMLLNYLSMMGHVAEGSSFSVDSRWYPSIGGTPYEVMAAAYPIAFLCLLIGATIRLRSRFGWLLVLPGFATCVFIVTYLATGLERFWLPTLPLELIAATLLVFGQLQADRWVRGGALHRFLPAPALLLIATVMHSSLSHNRGREAFYYACGMTAIIGLASVVGIAPEYLRRDVPSWAHRALQRGLAIGCIGALLYFQQYVF